MVESMTTSETATKVTALRSLLTELDSVLISFSGGVDSTLLLKIAHDTLGDRAVAATGLSASYASEEMDEAKAIAAEIGAEHLMVSTMELDDPRYADNSHQRCFFCKTELYSKLHEVARARGIAWVVDGANVDDVGDFRPGMRAAKQLAVRSPLLEVGLNKREIRELSAEYGLRTWDKPAGACLSSRFAYGDPITVEKLRRVGTAERGVRALGFKGFRIRHHDDLARLEVPADQIGRAIELSSEIVDAVKAAGYQYVTLDLEGYRTGRMNEVLHARLQPGGLRGSGAL
jgi:pyridinium-3,5-biscarboxylic acid mononucleotide sulfurtransferase